MKNNHNAIDLQHLNQYTGGDLELEQEIYGLFKEQVRIWLRLLPMATKRVGPLQLIHLKAAPVE
ncbi:MAG: hypothetical protein L3J04_09850 [Robiginitomaculum sp.]|nr:hypothetical protein [Robiginitomaculum sp.]